MAKRKTTEEFVADSVAVHRTKYCYDLVNYVNAYSKVIIICNSHGEFSQTPDSHLRGSGCPMCANDLLLTKSWEFIDNATAIHKGKYSYTRFKYVNARTKVNITCLEHGDFTQLPSFHLRGYGCPDCSPSAKKTTEYFIERAMNTHGNKYSYTNSVYEYSDEKVIITCPKHGDFNQTPGSHWRGIGCPKCAKYGFNASEPAVFYVYITDGFIGYGISCNQKVRHSNHRHTFKTKNIKADLFLRISFTLGGDAQDLEANIRRNFQKSKSSSDVKGFKRESVNTEEYSRFINFIADHMYTLLNKDCL